MKKLLIIREYFPGVQNPSASTWVLAQAQSMKKLGFSPLVISPTPIVPKYLLNSNRHKHSWRLKPSNVSERYLGVDVVRPGYMKLPSKYFLKRNIKAMDRIILKSADFDDYDFIHAHFGHAGVASLSLKKKFKKPLITSFYGYDLGSDLRKLSDGYKKLSHYGDLFLALSEDMKRDLIRVGFPESKIVVHHLGVDIEHFKPNDRVTEDISPQIVCLIVASFTERKGIHYAIKGFTKFANENPHYNVKLRIVGDGPYRIQLANLINGDSRITLLNNHESQNPRHMLLQEMQDCDIFLLTSITMPDGDKEGTPVVLMEAQACGKPCISTFHAGIPEVVIHEHTGILIKEKDVNSIAESLRVLVEDKQLRLSYGQNARAHIEKHFCQQKQMKRLCDIFNSLLN